MKRSPLGKLLILLIISAACFAFYLYKAEPGFLPDRFYLSIYADRGAAELEVMQNDRPVYFSLTGKEWNIQKNNGQWFTTPNQSDLEPDGADQQSHAVLTSHGDTLTVKADKEPDLTDLKIIDLNSGDIVLEQPADLSKLPLPDRNGSFIYELTLEWTGEVHPYRGRYLLSIPVTANLPEKFIFSQERLVQGQLLEVSVYYADKPDDIIFEQDVYEKFRWFEADGMLRGYLPTNYNTKPGVHQIRYGSKKDGQEHTLGIEISKYDYNIQHLTADPQMEKETRSDEAYAEYYKYYTPVRNRSEPFRYYTEHFILPVRGRLTTEFGETRYVNEMPTSYRHLGLDIAAPAGTEIKAANRGKVVHARNFILTGKTVMIDHGEGLFSVYHHMLNLSVKTGDIVERGQKIGEVGSTGFSTGPHLHFMISYFQTNLEPGYFLVGEPITYENYQKHLQ